MNFLSILRHRILSSISSLFGKAGWGLAVVLLLLSGVARAKVIGVIPGEPTQALATWYVASCTKSLPGGSYIFSVEPTNGAVMPGGGSGPAPGCPTGSPSLPYVSAIYTMNNGSPAPLFDYFQIQYILNGNVAETTDIFVYNSAFVAKVLGLFNTPNKQLAGEPIDIASGNAVYSVADYTTSGQNPLSFTRYYNSFGALAPQVPLPQNNCGNCVIETSSTLASTMGANWRSTYDRYLKFTSSTNVTAERPDGQQLMFTLKGNVWTPDSDIDMTLTQNGNLWTLTDSSDTVETYTVASLLAGVATSAAFAQLNSIRLRNGYTQTLSFDHSPFISGITSLDRLASVTDSYGRTLNLFYSSGILQSVTTPDGTTITYGYTNSILTSATYSTTPQTKQQYVYENTSYPSALTGVIDENGGRYATWNYDANGRAVLSQLGAGAIATKLVYNNDVSRTLTNALGVTDTYKFTMLQNIPKVTEIDRAATATTAAATEKFAYDANGYLYSQTDWNGNLTTLVNNIHGEPTTINEAVGGSAARTATVTYDSTWVHLPSLISTDGVDISYTYDGNGEQLTKTLTDTTSTTAPYSTRGQARTWTNTWSNFLLASTQTPNGNTTSFGYDGSGALTSITDPLKHATNITAHSGGGLPQTVVDPNGVTTTLVYDGRQRLISSTVTGTTGTYKTGWAFDLAGNLLTTTLPDGSFLTNAYDTAHRLTKTTDALGNYITYALDALGDRIQGSIYTKSGNLTWQRSGTFDALGRQLTDTGGAGQKTTRTFDLNGNVLTVTDGLSHTTQNTYDGLNRLSVSTDANGGITTPAYDSHNRIISVTDANGNATLYARSGFGDVIQQTSPDSGVSLFHYDPNANLTSKTDALGIVTNQTFDALDRPLTTAYPSDSAENVSYTYDQTGTGFSFGVGRLTSVTDAAGALTRSYEERGNLVAEVRVNGKTTLTTGYGYDGASRTANIAYPDGALVTYLRDAAGYVSSVVAKLPGATTATTLATLTHQPFGPMNGLSYGNGIAEKWAFDNAYRPTNITDSLSGKAVQNLTYGYDLADNVKSIADTVNAANTQSFGYDPLNRLTNATSATGGYGIYGWTYDPVGNRLTQTQDSYITSYGYKLGTNRLLTIGSPTLKALLGHPSFGIRANKSIVVASTKAPVSTQFVTKAFHAEVEQKPSTLLATVFGWPMLVLGFAGIMNYRKRLLKSPPLAIVILAALLTGGTTLLIGCGSPIGVVKTVAATPTFQVTPGSATTLPTLTISDTTIGSTLFYTTDGTTPTTSSIQYGGPFTVASGVTVKAIATASGYVNSNVASITLSLQTTPPAFSPAAGSYAAPLNVTLSDITPGAAIYYTTSGAAPSASSTPYTAPIPITGATTIQAIAIANGYTASPVVSASYALSLPTAATPTFSPAAGSLLPNQTVTIADATAGATIFYTTDGSTPSASSPQYSGPISVTGTETISAIAVASGYTNSAVARAIYTINGSCLNNVTTNANGNITNVPTADGMYCAVFTYNAANRVGSVTGTALAATMVYDWAGQRYSKTNGGLPATVFSYAQGGTLIAENDGGTVTDYVYVDGRPLAILQPGASVAANQVNYFLADRLGTPQQVANSAATPVSVWSSAHTPFGATGTVTASVNQGLRLPGQYADGETGFSYNLNRDYMPNLGRYLESDPVGMVGGPNTYSYANANPLKNIDPLGLSCQPNGGTPPPDDSSPLSAPNAGPDLWDAFWNGYGGIMGFKDTFLYEAQILATLYTLPEGGEGGEIFALEEQQAARGIGDVGEFLPPTTNEAGGQLFVSEGTIYQSNFTGIVSNALYKGDVNILSGVDGFANGTWRASAEILQEDVSLFSNIPRVNIYNIDQMTSAQIRNIINGPGTTIGAFCNSGACLLPYR
jgi:RHS repeat-associated protein